MNIENPVANALNGGGVTLQISSLTATDGHVLTVQANGTIATEAPSSGSAPVSSASDPTVNDDSSDGYAVGQLWINTTTDAAFILVDATVGAAVWRSLLPVNGLRITGVSGAPVMQIGLWTGNTFTAYGGTIAVTSSADVSGFGATWSGADLTVNAATAVAGNNDATAQRWSWQLPIVIPSSARLTQLSVGVSSFSEGARTASSVSSVGVSLGTSETTAVRTVAMIRPGSGTSYNAGAIGGSGTFSTLTGSATTVRITGTATIGDTLNGDTLMVRYLAGNDPTSCAGISGSGSPSATLPTWCSLYVQVTGANTTTTWTLAGLTLEARW